MNDHRVWQGSRQGVTTAFAGTGAATFSGDNGPATAAALNFPSCVAIGPGDVVFICDKANHRIRKVQGGVISTVAGTGVPGFTGDGTATAVALNQPDDAAIANGILYFTDQENNRLRQVDLATGALTTL